MKIVVIGGTGLIGSKLVGKLLEHGHEAIAAAPNTGVNTITGEGLAEVLRGAAAVVDVSNAPSWEDAAVLKFFETSTRNLLSHEAAAAVGHHVTLSVVGTQRLAESGYFRAKAAQETLITKASIPYSIVHATQFFEFLKGLADISLYGNKVRLPHVLFQPMAADDVAAGIARVAVGAPVNGTVEIAGPEPFRLDDLVRRRLAALRDPREVIADPDALYSGAKLNERTLMPGDDARLGKISFETWLMHAALPGAPVADQARKAG
ncbi:MAG: SDR family oxidoreductase [Terriglobales bacterium]